MYRFIPLLQLLREDVVRKLQQFVASITQALDMDARNWGSIWTRTQVVDFCNDTLAFTILNISLNRNCETSCTEVCQCVGASLIPFHGCRNTISGDPLYYFSRDKEFYRIMNMDNWHRPIIRQVWAGPEYKEWTAWPLKSEFLWNVDLLRMSSQIRTTRWLTADSKLIK